LAACYCVWYRTTSQSPEEVQKNKPGFGKAVFRRLDDWNLRRNIKGMCLHTTVSNTGQKAGACTLIEKGLGRNLLDLACQHHVMEIVAKKACSVMKRHSVSRELSLHWSRYSNISPFCDHWHRIDSSRFETALDLIEIIEFRERFIAFSETKVEANQGVY